MFKKVLLVLAIILVLIQFFRPGKNISDVRVNDITTKYVIPANVKVHLENACNDCHSNKTEYPWYSNIQPVAWWMNSHVNDGKRHLNFNNFTHRNIAYQNHKFEEIVEVIKEGEMPLPSYTWLGMHPAANLTEEEANEIAMWAQAQMDILKRDYPADSLVMKRRAG
jgi:hypothetical protein